MSAASTTAVTDPGVQERFEQLASQWRERSRYLSNPAQMAILPEYQRIIGMGAPAVRLILEELRREPDHWFWALNAITGENPVPPDSAGQVEKMAAAWVQWGVDHGFISPRLIAQHSRI